MLIGKVLGFDSNRDVSHTAFLPRIARIFTKFSSLPRIARIFTNFFFFATNCTNFH